MTSTTNSVSIACAANRAYAIPLTVMLRSAIDSLSPEKNLVAWVVDDGLGHSLRQRVEESLPPRGRIEWLDKPQRRHDGLPLWGRMPSTTYEKITIAEVLPPDLEKVIWLDCDMLVLADLAELWSLPIDGLVRAVRDTLVPTVSSRFGIRAFADLELAPSTPYFNAGILVFDPRKWREHRIASRAIDYLTKYRDQVFFWDQEALNVVLAGDWIEIDDRWNWSATRDRLSRHSNHSNGNGTYQQRIIHFSGNIKPWVVREPMDFDSAYFDVVDKTSWRGWRPDRTMTRSLLGWYGSSSVRRMLYPAEQIGLQLVRRLTQRQA